MSDTTPIIPNFIQIPPPNPPQTFDPKGIVEASLGVVSETGKGFIPATNFNPEQPYKDIKEFVEGRQERIDNSPLNPEKYIGDIKEAHKDNQQRREEHFTQRVGDFERFYTDRLAALTACHEKVLELKNAEIGQLHTRVAELKAERTHYESERDALVAQRFADLQTYNDRRIADLERNHASELALTERFNQFVQQTRDAEDQKVNAAKKALDTERESWVTHIQEVALRKTFWAKIRGL